MPTESDRISNNQGTIFDRFIDRRQTDSIKWSKYHGNNVIPLWIADMDFPSPKAVSDAICKRAEHGIFGYGIVPESLVEAVIQRMERLYHWQIEPGWIVWLPGLVPGINLACRAVGNDEDRVLTTIPVYPPFLTAPGYCRRRLTTVEMHVSQGKWQIDFQGLQKAVTPDTSLFLLCNPHNPTGRIFSRGELESMADICLRHDLVICSDEIHCDLLLRPDLNHIPMACLGNEVAERTITLMAPSKTFNIPGLGCSMAIIPNRELRARFKSSMSGIIPDVNIMGFVAAEAAFRDNSDWLEQLLKYLRVNSQLVYDSINKLPGLSMQKVEATYLAWIKVEQPNINEPAEFFKQAGVGLSDGRNFGAPGFIRLNFGCQRDLLQKALHRMAHALSKC